MKVMMIRWQAVHPIFGLQSGEKWIRITKQWRKAALSVVRTHLATAKLHSTDPWEVSLFAENGQRIGKWSLKVRKGRPS